jgi:hypothetical protein
MTTLVLKKFTGMLVTTIYQKLFLLKSKIDLARSFQNKLNIFPNLANDLNHYILMCKTIRRKKLKMKKHRFWKKYRARKETNPKK